MWIRFIRKKQKNNKPNQKKNKEKLSVQQQIGYHADRNMKTNSGNKRALFAGVGGVEHLR